MRISVIIPNYNYARFLPLAADSLLAQDEAVDEIIIVDDGSTDNSRDVIEAYGDKVIAIFQENAGQAAAISAGFARSTGDIVCILDSDDLFFPDKIRIIKKVYAAHKDAGWVFHDLKHLTLQEARNKDAYPEFAGDVRIRSVDCAYRMLHRGKLDYHAPATSGLTFRRDFIAPLFPLPAAESIYISDHYIKFYALAQGKGIDIVDTLGGQIIHGDNLYTGAKADATRAKIFANTGYALYCKNPALRKFSANLMAEALVCAKKADISHQVKDVAGKLLKNLSPREFFFFKLKVALKLIARNIH